ncbi:DNA-binding CsgD family transcriptional regulator [Mesorhizobium sp. J18]|nr:DNA-binding CsgD family transcriptional regulator [Mesorhizobium sp. J18]
MFEGLGVLHGLDIASITNGRIGPLVSMGGPLMLDTSELNRRLVGEAREVIENAAFDPSSWATVTEVISNVIPDSFAAVFNQDKVSDQFNLAIMTGMEATDFQSFLEYYGAINPWDRVWAQRPQGHILVSESEAPLHSFSETEFFRDFYRHLGGFEAGVGTRLNVGNADDLYVSFHYPISLANRIDDSVAMAMQQLQGHFARAIEINRKFANAIDKSVSAAALINRGEDIGFAVDFNMRLLDTNPAADLALALGNPICASNGVVRLKDENCNKWIIASVRSLLAGRQPLTVKRLYRDETALWQISILPVPEPVSAAKRFVSLRRVVVVLMRNLSISSGAPDNQLLAQSFKLTPAEIRLCLALADGLTLREAAERLAITRETVRDRLKTVFQKTGTNRQSELISLLIRLR